jgi:multiple sugar transport system ATP-binding protein
MAIVQTRGLTKVFREGQVGAVVGVDLESREGEFLVLLGPSGSGKTTLLRMIAGLEEPTSGEIWIGGVMVNDMTPRERRIAMVFQSYALYPHLTVLGNIVFPLKAQRTPAAEREKKAKWAADLLGIGHLMGRRPRELSGGERQRVALARAIVREPTVFLLDEPLSNLDAKLRASAREELEQFQRRVGTTMIYVTHDQVEAMAMGDRVVVMHQGKVRQIGTPADVYDDPADTFVATFLGSPPMNLLKGEGAVIGFRPEHLLPAGGLAEGSPATLSLPFRVEHEEYLGSERILYGRLAGGAFDGEKAVSRLPATFHAGGGSGAVLQFQVERRKLKYFDKETGKRRDPVPVP